MKKGTFQRIYEVVKKIPKGKVATYGKISKTANSLSPSLSKITPRIVGWALHANKNKKVPCHRVVNKDGKVANNYAFGGAAKQKEILIKEGVEFKDNFKVDLEKYLHS